MEWGEPQRYLVAHVGEAGSVSLIRFPPGLVLDDATGDEDLEVGGAGLVIPARAMAALERLGARVVAEGDRAALRREAERLAVSGRLLVEYERDYLDVNMRLGPGRWVSMLEYAMDTVVLVRPPMGGKLALGMLHQHVRPRGCAFGAGGVWAAEGVGWPVRLRPSHVFAAMGRPYRPWMACALHGDCRLGPAREDWTVPWRATMGVRGRVEIGLGEWESCLWGRWQGAARRALELVGAYGGPAGATFVPPRRRAGVAECVAYAMAGTCEEQAMLAVALRGCESLAEMARRARDAARDPSWVVSRVLESLGGRG